MFLIDSSVWIEYFRRRGSLAVKDRVRGILQREEAASCGIIAVEILRGAKTEKEFQALQESLMALPQIAIDASVVERAARWGFLLDRKGKTVSTTDLLIAAAAFKNAILLHLDNDFKVISSVVDLEEEMLKIA